MLKVKNLTIQFGERKILETSFEVKQGIVSAFIGESGSGKSSLFNILSLYKYDQSFDYSLDDVNLRTLTEEEIQHLQKTKISYLTQQPHFIDALSCKENLLLECEMSGSKNEKLVEEVLNQVGLLKKKNTLPKKLSGGEKQRLAISCAMIKDSDLIICDEITSSLDNTNTEMIMNILLELAHDKGKTILVASHEKKIIELSDEVYEIKEGTLEKVKSSEKEVKDIVMKEMEKTSKSYLKKLSFARMKKKKSLFLILVAIVSIVVSSVTYFYTWTNQRITYLEDYMTSYLMNELMVMHNFSRNPVVLYRTFQPPFTKEFVGEFMEIDAIESVYPIYAMSLMSEPGRTNHIELHENGTLIRDYNLSFYDIDLSENVFPCFDEENVYQLCETKSSQEKGIYLNYYVAQYLGIEEVKDGMTLTFDLEVPVAQIDVPCTIGYGGSGSEEEVITEDSPHFDYTGIDYVHETIRVTLPIAGVLPLSYQSLGTVEMNLILISNDFFSKYIEECVVNHTFKEEENSLEANTYKVFLKNVAVREETISLIKSLDENVEVLDSYENYAMVEKAIDEVETNFMIPALMVAGLGFVLLLAYSFQHRKDVIKDYYFMNIRGITKQERQKISWIEFCLTGLLFTMISMIITNLFITNGIAEYQLMTINGYQINYALVVLIDILVSFISAFICECTVLFESR